MYGEYWVIEQCDNHIKFKKSRTFYPDHRHNHANDHHSKAPKLEFRLDKPKGMTLTKDSNISWSHPIYTQSPGQNLI